MPSFWAVSQGIIEIYINTINVVVLCNFFLVWIRALTAAANGEHKLPELDYDRLYEKLGLDPEIEHEPSAVNRAFRQLALQDKSGKPEGVSVT